jgi:hypothetical protein
MAQETKVAENNCLIPTFERNRYFFGKPMTVSDFEAEQQYLIGKSRLQNRLIHGAGIICGMQASNPKIADGKFTIDISEGAAFDCCGNLIVVNRSDKVEVQAQGVVPDGKYYLYIRFSECVRQPITASANVSSCEEVCCYNRIRETFEVSLSGVAPNAGSVAFTGSVKTGSGGITGAKVKALQKGIVQAETLTDDNGNYRLGVAGAGIAFDIAASATGFSTLTRAGEMIPLGQVEKQHIDLDLTVQAGESPADVCSEMTQDYFDGHSRNCLRCDDPKVFLAIATFSGGGVTIDTTSSDARRDRSVVYTNPMLHDLFCDHVSDFNNPHRTTAEQVRALQRVNNVGNLSGRAYVSNIDLVSEDGTIVVSPDPDNDNQKVDLKLAVNAVRLIHLNEDTINNLLTSDGTIAIQPNTTGKTIGIKTNRATTVTSVGTAKVVGIAPSFAPGDHAHDLAERVVTKAKLADEVINTLLDSDGTITITPDLVQRKIRLATIKAKTVSSVGGNKIVGDSQRFAPEDHAHNLQINERAPDENGLFRLTPGANVQIQSGAANELIIGAEVAESFKVTTGLVRFEGIRINDPPRTSPPIRHGLEPGKFAIVLGLELKEEVVIGDLSTMSQRSPLLEARYTPGRDTFQIDLRDTSVLGTSLTGNFPNIPVSYSVRWWAIPSTREMEPVVSLPPQPLPPA